MMIRVQFLASYLRGHPLIEKTPSSRFAPSNPFLTSINCVIPMNPRATQLNTRLRRLDAENYRGFAYVHWTMGMQDRACGWLTTSHHAALRELLLHTCLRYHLACPIYCIMPDHAHFLWVGLDATSDQRLASAWFRRHWNRLL